MPDDETTTPSTDWEAEYKKLQRKTNRIQKRADTASREVAELRASTARIESMAERLFDNDNESDKSFRESIASQREKDIAAARAEVEVASLLDETDVDFDTDPRLSDARRLVAEVQETGNLALVEQIKTTIRGLTSEPDSSTSTDDTDEKIRQAILADRQEHGRVDTNRTSAPDLQVSRSDLSSLDPTKGVAAIKDTMKQLLDQIYNQG